MSQAPVAILGSKEKAHLVLLRKSSNNKIALKEKIVQIYEGFFQGEDPSTGNANFWDELFLLKLNTVYIENEFEKLSGEGLLSLKENINLLFYKSVETLKQESPIRVFNALQTICALIRGVFKKSHGDYGFDIINILMGFDSAEILMQALVEAINTFLTTQDCHASVKQAALKTMLILLTATDNVSQNTVLEYMMINSVFESLVQILGNASARLTLGSDAVLLLTLLVQYRKYESANPYIVKLSILDDELAMTGYAQTVSLVLSEFNRDFQLNHTEPQTGWFSSFTSMVGNMFVGEEHVVELMKANDSILLALYEAVHLNRNFITALTYSHTPSCPSSPVLTSSPPFEYRKVELMPAQPESQPTNLLVTLLEYSSIIMQDTKDDTRQNNAKLCLIILTCIAEDQYANSMMHDVNMNFRVPLHRTPMRHRKCKLDAAQPSQPLACALLDLMVEFVLSHMMKTFPMELYIRCLGIIHRVLCYQKKCRVRLQYEWKHLWTALIHLLKFVLSHESQLVKKHNIFHLASKVVNLFNLFITYGDTFLPTPNSYDELYYEVIRMHQVFDNLYSMALRYTSNEGDRKDAAVKLTNNLINIRAIINHFTPRVDSWAAVNHLSSLTEEQVLEVVRCSYDTLTLKLQDCLDQFERYSEKPREMAFFTQLVRSIICDVRKYVAVFTFRHMDVVHELES